MKLSVVLSSLLLIVAAPVWAHDTNGQQPSSTQVQNQSAPVQLDAHALEDIKRHRAMAYAHERAAQCLANGSAYDECQKQLKVDCKGLALGKNCGMRHTH